MFEVCAAGGGEEEKVRVRRDEATMCIINVLDTLCGPCFSWFFSYRVSSIAFTDSDDDHVDVLDTSLLSCRIRQITD